VPADPERFDADYYRRFYGDAETRVVSRREVARLVRFVTAYLAYLELPVRRVLDAGCGLGWWRAPLLRRYPKAVYTGIELSPHLCRERGWERASVVDYRAAVPFDLVTPRGPDEAVRLRVEVPVGVKPGSRQISAYTTPEWRARASVRMRRPERGPALRLRASSC